MRFVDRVLRSWRVSVALRYVRDTDKNAFDIGCDDGFLLEKLGATIVRRDGIDPRLSADVRTGWGLLKRGFFPSDVDPLALSSQYDVIFSLAVFEHFSEADIHAAAETIARMLTPGGRLIVTVPHPFVDKILDVLIFLRVIDGQAVDEHHGFDPGELKRLFSRRLRLTAHKKFQLGLNNLFVFEL